MEVIVYPMGILLKGLFWSQLDICFNLSHLIISDQPVVQNFSFHMSLIQLGPF